MTRIYVLTKPPTDPRERFDPIGVFNDREAAVARGRRGLLPGEMDCASFHVQAYEAYPIQIATCGHCGRSWDDTTPTDWTPAPSGRCPFEYEH